MPERAAGWGRARRRSSAPDTPWGPRPPRDTALTALAVVVALLVALGVSGGLWVLRRSTAAGPAPPTAAVVLTELTRGPDLLAAAVVALGPAGATCVLVPSTLLVRTSLPGPVALGSTLGSAVGVTQGAVSGALGVRIDGSWRLSVEGLAQLVDAAGGVVTTVEQEVRSGDVVIAAGAGQRLSGAQAVAFVAAAAGGGTVGLERFAVVLGQVVAGLPATGRAAGEQLAGLGAASTSTLAAEQLGGFLVELRPSTLRAGLRATVLPVQSAGPGEAAGTQLDRTAAELVLRRELPAAVLVGPRPAATAS